MKKLLVTFLLTILSFITYSQSGVGYLNYTIYNTNGSSYRNSYPNSNADFLNLFNTSTGATIYKTGTTTALNALYYSQTFFTGVPNGASYFGIETTGWFVPKETGTYTFAIDGDDAVDFLLDGVVVTSFYGPHGFGGYRYGTINLVAGKTYTLTARFQQVGGGWGLYVIWKRPSQSTYSLQADECYSTSPSTPTKKAVANFNFNTNITPTTFSVGSALSSTGTLDITSLLDSNKVNTGYKATITSGQVEWSYTNPNASWLGSGNSRLLIDMRQVGGVDPTKINSVKIFDAYEGNMTYTSHDANGWAIYTIPSPLTKITDGTSANNSSIRNVNGWNTDYAFQSTISLAATQSYKTQSITATTTNNLTTLYNSIVTVSDVYLAFKELANGGIFGNQSGNEFGYGIQFKNADVNDDGYFNEKDCFALLQNLTGAKTLVDTFNLNKTMRIISQPKYDSIGKSNWNTFTTPLGSSYSFDINTGKTNDTLNLAVAWKGDVNLSHSTTPKSNNLTTMSVRGMSISNDINASIITEVVSDSVCAYITIDPLSQFVVGTQFQLNYDNSLLKFSGVKFITKGSPMNYSTDKGAYINLGSLISDGSTTLDNTTTYKISFSSNKKLDNILGLISIGSTDAVNKDGKTLKVKMN
jgi:hypothetical protein